MTLTALRCPNCSALVQPGATTLCSYCGATLVATEPEANDEPRVVSVYLDDAGEDKIPVMHAIRKHLQIALVESRDLVLSAPCEVASNISEPLAKTLLTDLRILKAKARITTGSKPGG